jgi:hypothetical protein
MLHTEQIISDSGPLGQAEFLALRQYRCQRRGAEHGIVHVGENNAGGRLNEFGHDPFVEFLTIMPGGKGTWWDTVRDGPDRSYQ